MIGTPSVFQPPVVSEENSNDEALRRSRTHTVRNVRSRAKDASARAIEARNSGAKP